MKFCNKYNINKKPSIFSKKDKDAILNQYIDVLNKLNNPQPLLVFENLSKSNNI
jgi:hypothetical protein